MPHNTLSSGGQQQDPLKKKMPLMGISSVVERLPGVCEALGSEKNPWPLKTCPGLGRKEGKKIS